VIDEYRKGSIGTMTLEVPTATSFEAPVMEEDIELDPSQMVTMQESDVYDV